MIVVDASVAVKWLLPEVGDDAAKAFLATPHRLVAPALIRIEVAGAVLRANREDRLPEARARDVIAAWGQMLDDALVHLIADDELFPSAVEISLKSRHALQDCLYLAAAKAVNGKLVTADRAMYQRGGKAAAGITLLDGA